jgi:hypothetical protein
MTTWGNVKVSCVPALTENRLKEYWVKTEVSFWTPMVALPPLSGTLP